MSEVNWNLISGAVPAPVDPLTSIRAGDLQRAQQAAAATIADVAQRKFVAEQAAAARQQAAQTAAAEAWRTGKTREAQASLLGAGANDLFSTVNTADKQQFDQHTEGMKAVGGFAKYIMEHIADPEVRAQVIRHNAPLLIGAGATQDDIEAVANDPSDDVLGGVAHQYYTPQDQDKTAQSQDQIVINSQNADTQARAESRLEQTPIGIATTSDVYVPGGTTAPSSGFVPGAQLATIFSDIPGARITSTNRSAEHNKEVGGVANSQHVSGTAVDMVGVTPAQAKAALTARGLTGEVIQHDVGSGLHVHVESVRPINGGTRGPQQIASGVPKTNTNSAPVAGNSNLTGQAYLASLPASNRAMIQAIADGRAAPPNSRTKQGAAILAQVAQYDPTFDSANAHGRSKTWVAFTTGPQGKSIAALNTAIGHAADLYRAADKLGNFSVAPGVTNPVYNWARGNIGGNTELKNFRANAFQLAEELTASYKGAGGSLHEVDEFKNQLNSSQSPAQIKAVVKGMVSRLNARLDSLGQGFAQGMGRTDVALNLVTPHAAKQMQSMGLKADPEVVGPIGTVRGKSAPAPSASNIPQEAISHLKQNPGLRSAFDQKYGAGSAARVLGR